MKNKEIAEIFRQMGALLEMKDENIFRIRSYYKAADSISNLAEDIASLRAQDHLAEIPGIGKTLAEKINEYLDHGKIAAYEKLTREVPLSLLTVMQIPSVGPKKAKLFFSQLHIRNIDELENAANSGQLNGLEGIKDKTIEKILNGIKIVRQGQERMDLGKATEVASGIVRQLKDLPQVRAIAVAGSLRRCKETIGDIDILVDSNDPKAIMDVFVNLSQVKRINSHGETKSSVWTKDNIQVDLRVVPSKSWGAAMLYFTGSTSFNIKLRQIAIKKGLKVNEYGVINSQGQMVAVNTERACLAALGLPEIPPELREDLGEDRLFPEGRQTKIPQLIDLSDIRGDLHVHSNYSDGQNTIREMADAAYARGYEYLAISDHSQKLKVAGGLSQQALEKKKKEIDELNKSFKNFRILFSAEVEIDIDGNLDYNEKILTEFDVVIAAVHSGFNQSSKRMTARLVKACCNPYVHILAHPTGVHLGKREPYPLDFAELCRVAKEENTFLEINSFPIRLDLNSANVYFANQAQVSFSINTDAHHVDHLEYMKFGVAMARRGWVEKKQVLNCQSLNELLKTIRA